MNIGIVRIADEVLLDFLQFSHGKILNAVWDSSHCVVRLTIEHNEMPEVSSETEAKVVTPHYTRFTSDNDSIVVREPLIECEHDWVKLRNKAIRSGKVCRKCKAIDQE